ncbi:post-transcriptional regulator [Bacillus carboniphilus]|uniref:Post-transcriptional regulator n=1 Tax=Bacillus carboniphilus TaxID=86663 RepID=A0ABY9K0G2_9BACI|nr:post-transcriptional regulator [Bacillus carboniphilus]WLR44058.1 post-transcriptional regulator [Bacillus carboniphilus]
MTEKKHPVDTFRDHVRPFLKSKLEEFKFLDYDEVTEDELWSYLKAKKWRKNQDIPIHQIVSDISSMKIVNFMNFATVESYKTSSWFGSKEGEELLKEVVQGNNEK